jgi:hypothetical protein
VPLQEIACTVATVRRTAEHAQTLVRSDGHIALMPRHKHIEYFILRLLALPFVDIELRFQ